MKKTKLLVFMGPPGSGKGSLSQLFSTKFNWKQLSTGDLCRKHISEGSEIGQQIDFSIKSGKLIPDELISRMVEQWLIAEYSEQQGIILDGYPRTLDQARFLLDIINKKLKCDLNIIKLLVSDQEILVRVQNRYVCTRKDCQAVYSKRTEGLAAKIPGVCDVCSGPLVQRSDDALEIIAQRLKTYHLYDKDLTNFYRTHGRKICEINGERSIDKVFEDLKNLVVNI